MYTLIYYTAVSQVSQRHQKCCKINCMLCIKCSC